MSTPDDDRGKLIAAIEAHHAGLRREFALQRPNPMLDSGLTIQQLRALVLLASDGPLPQGELAHALSVGLATTTGLVDRLVARGLVERTEDPRDRRVRRAGLTPAGTQLLEQVASEAEESLRGVLAMIDIDSLRALEHGLGALQAALEHVRP